MRQPNVSDFAVSSFVLIGPLITLGASSTGLTVTVTVAVLESTVPSFALNVKLSVPEKFSDGV